MIIKEDCYSHFRPSVKYAAAGEEVTVISDNGNVLIVENDKGERFPVTKSSLLNNLPTKSEPAVEQKQIIKPVQPRKRTKAVPPKTQQTLL